ncbi:MAG TPA: 6-phosphogluconolactonase [Gemmatimonadaceae bacterium]|nr:6-phosphogluconolactonase [Gemmatimonadaceae bacterium]
MERAPEASIHADLEALSHAAAAAIVQVAEDAVRERGWFALSLAGGSTPRRLYELLATTYSERMPWARTHLFFGDERCVPPTDPASNYHMAFDALLNRVPIAEKQVHRIRGEIPPLDAAREYGRMLRRFFATGERGAAEPHAPEDVTTFDIALLGIGPDGHTASLFPGSPVLDERAHWVVEVEAPAYIAPPRQRITLTLPVLNGARDVFLFAAGEEKTRVVAELLSAEARRPSPYPAGRVSGTRRTVWWLDRAAAGDIGGAEAESR